MATAILPSRNSLNHRFDHDSLIHRSPNSRLRRHSSAATTKAPPRLKRASQSKKLVASPASNTNLVMGQVKILKRGETLSAFLNKENNSRDDKKRHRLKISDVGLIVASWTNRIGPEPEIVDQQIGAIKGLEIVSSVGYAGSCNSVSPPPCSLPIPCFLEKKN